MSSPWSFSTNASQVHASDKIFPSQGPKFYGKFGIHQIEKNVLDMASKSTNVEWTAQCITTPSEFLQTTHQPPTYSSPISSPLLLIPPLNRCPSMYALHLKGREQSVTLTPAAPSDSRTERWKTSDRLTG